MKEVIANQIENNVLYIAFYLGIAVLTTVFIVLRLMVFEPIKLSKANTITPKLTLMFFLLWIVAISVASIIPPTQLTINLITDYSEPTVLSKEGFVVRRPSIGKMSAIEIDNELFILSPYIGEFEKGDYCKIEYFKYSKYVCDLSVKH